MGTGRGQEKKQTEHDRVQQQTAYEGIKKSPLELQQEKTATDFLTDWAAGKGADSRGLESQLSLYQSAKTRENASKLGQGIFDASARNGGSTLASALKNQNDANQEQAASGQLYDASNNAFGYYSGTLAPQLINSNNQINAQRFDAASGIYGRQLNDYRRPSGVGNFLRGLAGGAAQVGAAYINSRGSGGGSTGG